jgi:putative SOS response-associated peptidase YedK
LGLGVLRHTQTTGRYYDKAVAPVHNRQMVILNRDDWTSWLDLTRPERELLKPLAAGSLTVEQVRS